MALCQLCDILNRVNLVYIMNNQHDAAYAGICWQFICRCISKNDMIAADTRAKRNVAGQSIISREII